MRASANDRLSLFWLRSNAPGERVSVLRSDLTERQTLVNRFITFKPGQRPVHVILIPIRDFKHRCSRILHAKNGYRYVSVIFYTPSSYTLSFKKLQYLVSGASALLDLILFGQNVVRKKRFIQMSVYDCSKKWRLSHIRHWRLSQRYAQHLSQSGSNQDTKTRGLSAQLCRWITSESQKQNLTGPKLSVVPIKRQSNQYYLINQPTVKRLWNAGLLGRVSKTKPCVRLANERKSHVWDWPMKGRAMCETGQWKEEPCLRLANERKSHVWDWPMKEPCVSHVWAMCETGQWKEKPCLRLANERKRLKLAKQNRFRVEDD